MLTRTVVFPLNLDAAQTEAVEETLHVYTQVWGRAVDVAWPQARPHRFSVHKRVYGKARKIGLKSQLAVSAIARAVESVKASRVLAKRRNKNKKPENRKPATKPRVKTTIPVRLDARTLSFDKPRETASFMTQHGRVRVPLVWHKQARRYRAWNCKSGEIGRRRDGRFVLRLHFTQEALDAPCTDRVVGVDSGIRNPAVASDNRFICNDRKGKWKAHERRLLSLRSRLQSKGTKSAKRHLKKLSGRLRRFRIDCDRALAKELLAPFSPGDTIVLEDLTGLRERVGEKSQRKANKPQRTRLGRWTYARRTQAIEDRAEVTSVRVERVAPRYTSQRCPACGERAKRRKARLRCLECGLDIDADLAAARNIEFLWRSAIDAASGPPVNRPDVGGSVKFASHPAYKLSPSGDSR
ncbi:IS200/IS605 family element transposase accessory protein TnpB [Candidatus Bathyarchaeota archaeon]|nr:IS200/IS605 family element transposase accessory protein TnpB [Candidatus Bathyarchaeota archaeon]